MNGYDREMARYEQALENGRLVVCTWNRNKVARTADGFCEFCGDCGHEFVYSGNHEDPNFS